MADDTGESTTCGATITPASQRSREINLVIDDSGSMFYEGDQALDRWSYAKYSLEVFAAMLEQNDSLNVYRMSDFATGGSATPQVQLSGSEPASSRVAKIHDMPLLGSRTPYAPVTQANADLAASDAQDKWLVIATDGEFNDRDAAGVQADLKRFVIENNSEASRMKVAFLAIGDEAPEIPNDPEGGIYFARAAGSADLLSKMTGFSNRIFERNIIDQEGVARISPDIALETALVFAQGQDVEIGAAQTTKGAIEPVSTVEVSWADNPGEFGKSGLPAVANKDLRGKLATFENLPAGDIVFDVTGAQTVTVFFKPKVDFGIQIRDAQGQLVDADKIVGGDYTLTYGFMDDECNVIESDLLGDVKYTARAFNNGDVIADKFQSGDVITLNRGDVRLDVSASFLGGNTSNAAIDLKVLQPAAPAALDATDMTYDVSKLGTYSSPADAIELVYVIERDGVNGAPTAEEWATISPDSFEVTSSTNIDFAVQLGSAPGEVFLLPLAPNGDVYSADVGDIPIHIEVSHTYDEQLMETKFDTRTVINDDISSRDRLAHWFATTGWKLLALVIALILLLGYLLKRRFSKKVKPRPTISGVPRQIGSSAEQAAAKFRVKSGRRFLPFVADKATLTYVPPGVTGFRALKLKAGPRKTMIVTNWKELAQKNNVEVNGTPLNEETRRAPTFGPSATITATTPQMTYEMTPNA